MNTFCENCGTPIIAGESRCRNCGVALRRGNKENVTVQKVPLSGRQKKVRIMLGVLVVASIGFSIWAKTSHSADAVEKQFNEAILAKDTEKISKLTIHEDGTKIKETEAEALLKLVEEEGKETVEALATTVKHGKFLAIYDNHKVKMISQFVYYDDPNEGLTFQFNGKKMNESTRLEDQVVFGPMSPGIYNVEAVFEGKYGSASSEVTLNLASDDRDEQLLDIDLLLAKVVFAIEDFDSNGMTDAFIVFNDEKFPVNEDGETEAIGPFLIDGTQIVKATAKMPWGEGTSAETPIDSDYVTISAGIISDEQYAKITSTLLMYGNQYQEAFARRDIANFTTITNNLKEQFEEPLLNLLGNGIYYSGKFITLKMDRTSLTFVKDEERLAVGINAQFFSDSATYQMPHVSPLIERTDEVALVLYYDEKQNEWKVTSTENSVQDEFIATEEFEGSGIRYDPEITKTEISMFLSVFHEQGIAAINERDFSLVEDYHTTEGKSRKELKDYIVYLESKGITEDYLGAEVEKVEQINDSTWKVTSIEQFRIIQDGSSKEKKFRSVTIVKRINSSLKMDELLSTVEI